MSKMSDKAASQERAKPLRFDVLYLLGRLGLRSLRTKVFLAGLLFIVVSLALVGTVAYWSFFSAIDASGELRQSAATAAKTVDMLIFENIEFAKSIASDPYVVNKVEQSAAVAESMGIHSTPDAGQIQDLETRYNKTRVLEQDAALNEFLNDKKRIKGVFQRMFITDRYGLNVGMTSMTEDFVQSDEAWWQEAMKRGVYVDDVGFDKPSGTWALEICVAIPNPKTGQPNGVLKVKYNLGDVQQYITDFKQYQTGNAYAVTQTGLYVLQKDPAKRDQEIGSGLAKAGLLKAAAENDVGTLDYSGMNPETRNAEDRVISYARSKGFSRNGVTYPGFGWIFVVDNSRAEVYAPAYRMLGRLILIGVLLLLLLSGLAYLFSSSLSSAVRKLYMVTEWVRAGDLMARVQLSTGDELERVADGFNQMMNRLAEMVRAEMDQKQALLLISKAVESSGDAIAIRDQVRSSAYYNKTFTDLTGSSSEELLKAEANLSLYKDPGVARVIMDTLEKGEPWNGEIEIMTRDGAAVPVSLRANAIKDESGNIIGRIGIHSDITERKKMEEALLNSEEQYRLLFDSNPHPMWVFDSETLRFLAVNEAAVRHYGYTRDEFLAMTIKSIRPEEDVPDLLAVGVNKVHRGEGPVNWRHKKKDGSLIDVEINAHPLQFAGHNAQLVLANDVTERRKMEETVRKSELEYRNLFESANDPILIFEPDSKLILEVNTRTLETYGFTREEMVGMSVNKLTRDAHGADEHIKRALQGEARNYETVHFRKDGTPVYILQSSSVIDYRGQRAILGIARDISDRKKAEEELARSLKEFLALVSVVSEGDLTRRGSELEGPLSTVLRSINKMLDNFSTMLTRVKQIGLSVTSSATEILAASEQIAAGAQRQADEITNTSSAVEEMAASMSQVSRNAEASAEAARRALGMAENGDRSVKDTSEAMGRIDTAVQVTADKMRLLAKRSSEISEIIDLINDVAAQTNLLSLNAAIEAAHAGEAGLGFSVVAEEIRKLAERSARATRDVGNLIKAIQTETSEALSAMENGMKEVKDGSTLAEQARQSLQDISNVVRQSAELIEEISAASEEQARVTRNLAGAMQTVSSITLETSAGAHETAQTIQGMVSLSEQLNDAISQFRVKDDFVHPFSYEVSGEPGKRGNGSRYAGLPGAD